MNAICGAFATETCQCDNSTSLKEFSFKCMQSVFTFQLVKIRQQQHFTRRPTRVSASLCNLLHTYRSKHVRNKSYTRKYQAQLFFDKFYCFRHNQSKYPKHAKNAACTSSSVLLTFHIKLITTQQ